MKTSINIVGGRNDILKFGFNEQIVPRETMTIEKQLGTLAGDEEESRVQVVQISESGETPTLEMRTQHYTDDLGWQTHRRVTLAPGQIAALRDMLNLMDPDARDTVIDHDTEADEQSPALELVSQNTG